jgi:predicted membrane protein
MFNVFIPGDQRVSVHLMIKIQKVTINVQSVPRQSPDRQGQGDTRITLTQSVIPNSNYVILVSD